MPTAWKRDRSLRPATLRCSDRVTLHSVVDDYRRTQVGLGPTALGHDAVALIRRIMTEE